MDTQGPATPFPRDADLPPLELHLARHRGANRCLGDTRQVVTVSRHGDSKRRRRDKPVTLADDPFQYF